MIIGFYLIGAFATLDALWFMNALEWTEGERGAFAAFVFLCLCQDALFIYYYKDWD